MNPFAAATATIQFIGLVTFSSQMSNDAGMHAILPRARIQVTNPLTNNRQSASVAAPATKEKAGAINPTAANPLPELTATPVPTATAPPMIVEEHSAIIVFSKDDYYMPEKTKNWTPVTIHLKNPDGTPNDNFLYVSLNGERVTFATSGNTMGAGPARTLDLPGLGTCCTGATDLTTWFKRPYPGAAAVVDVPAGAMSSCSAVAHGVNGRIDTRLYVDNDDTITIQASRLDGGAGQREITLDGMASMFIANVPTRWLKGDLSAHPQTANLAPHYQAYYAMVNTTISHCKSLDQCPGAATNAPPCTAPFIPPPQGGSGNQTMTFARMAAAPTRVGSRPRRTNGQAAFPPDNAMYDFQCSNSTWP